MTFSHPFPLTFLLFWGKIVYISGICCPITCRHCKCHGDGGRNIDVGDDDENIDFDEEEEQSSSDDESGLHFIPYDPYADMDFSISGDEL